MDIPLELLYHPYVGLIATNVHLLSTYLMEDTSDYVYYYFRSWFK